MRPHCFAIDLGIRMLPARLAQTLHAEQRRGPIGANLIGLDAAAT